MNKGFMRIQRQTSSMAGVALASMLVAGTAYANPVDGVVSAGAATISEAGKKLDIVGIYPDFKSAETAWKAKAQATVDNAHMRYFIVHLHRLLDPDTAHH